MPLPQADLVQVLFPPAWPVHVASGSTEQTAEQPSPPVVLPSSHASPPTLTPSPQIGTHRRPGTRQS
jgi:hypothetical protein